MSETTTHDRTAPERIAFFDMLRGLVIISMIAFHATYDAAYIYGFHVPWFIDPVIQDVWRATISWTFLALAGWMTSLSRNNFKRAVVYGIFAFIIWLATSVVSVDTPVSFGIIYCMGFCTLIYALIRPVHERINPVIGLILSLALFGLLWHIPRGTYDVVGFSWLGFPGPGFASGDYYPPIPFLFMYLAGSFAAKLLVKLRPAGYPAWMKRDTIPYLSWLGRHSLAIYVIHQPLLIACFELISR